MKKIDLIEEYLEELNPNPKCEINYNNEYELLISIVLSAQTTDKRVNEVNKVLFTKYNSLEKLKNADIDDLKEILRPLGNYNKKALYVKNISTTLVDSYNSKVPHKRKELESLDGVGRKTASVFLSELNIEPAIAVDTHVERVSKRLGLSKKDDTVLEVEKRLRKVFKKEDWNKRHLQLLLFGRYKCKAISPKCDDCRLSDICLRGK